MFPKETRIYHQDIPFANMSPGIGIEFLLPIPRLGGYALYILVCSLIVK